MQPPLVQIEWDGKRIRSLKPDHILRAAPAEDEPTGHKCAQMADYWREIRGSDVPGVIWMDPDIVADPYDLALIREDIEAEPGVMRVTPHRLWPAATHRDEWAWAHGHVEDGRAILDQIFWPDPEWMALGFTYTPRRLLNIAVTDMPAWHFTQCDIELSRYAREFGIKMGLTYWSEVKHVHFNDLYRELDWTRQP